MTDHDDQLRNSAAVPAGQPHDELHSSTTEWLRRAMDGIKQMHESEDVRQKVARGIFWPSHLAQINPPMSTNNYAHRSAGVAG
ncbi:hypothetical protein ACQUKI_15950 [Ralstonia pseudosolanacearum]